MLVDHHVDHSKPAQSVTNSASQDVLVQTTRYLITVEIVLRYHNALACLKMLYMKQVNRACKTATYVNVIMESGLVQTTCVQLTPSVRIMSSSQAV